MTLSLDLSWMLADNGVAGGISADAWGRAGSHAARAHSAFEGRVASGALGFLKVPADAARLTQVQDAAAAARGKFDDVVVLGIGGSSLGAIAVRTALRPWGWNLLGADRRDGFPRLHVLDSPDPGAVAALLDLVDLRRTLFLVVSKSGGTAETMAQYLVVRDRLQHVHGERARDHLWMVTDPTAGPLRALATKEGYRALDVPSDVGGRFSVLTPVGLLPAALSGVDVAAMLAGAGEMATRCRSTNLEQNPALAWAVAQWLAHTAAGKGLHVFMPYADALRDLSAWFVQLWAESLGKAGPMGTGVGPTPVPAVGPADQHAQVQLFMEGPADKTVTFVAVRTPAAEVVIPAGHPDVPEAAYLGGHTLHALVDAERRATAAALAERGRPSATMTIDAVDPWHVGGLIMWLQCATVYAAGLYDVNPLDQPGVELGKRYTGALLGRAGTAAERAAFDAVGVPRRPLIIGP
jgi:glucose-6-phosphate isomerase